MLTSAVLRFVLALQEAPKPKPVPWPASSISPWTKQEIGPGPITNLLKVVSEAGPIAIEFGSDKAAAGVRLVDKLTIETAPPSWRVFLEDTLRHHGLTIEHCGQILALRSVNDEVDGTATFDDRVFVPVESVERFADLDRSLITVFKATKATPERILEESKERFPAGSSLRLRAVDGAPILALSGRAVELVPQIPWIRSVADVGEPRSEDPPKDAPPGTGDELILQFDETGGTPLADLVAYANEKGKVPLPLSDPQLGSEKRTVHWRLSDPQLGSRKLLMFGRVRVPAEAFPSFVEDIARAMRLRVRETETERILLDDSTGSAAEEREASLADLDSIRHRRAQFMLRVPLEHLDAQRAVSFLHAYCGNARFERAIPEKGRNELRLYGPGHLVARNADLIRACDRLAAEK